MLEKVVNKDKIRDLGRKDADVYRRREKQDFQMAEERSKMDEAVLSAEYDAMKQIQEHVRKLRLPPRD